MGKWDDWPHRGDHMQVEEDVYPRMRFRGNWMSQQTVRWCHYWQAIHRKLERLPSSFLFRQVGWLTPPRRSHAGGGRCLSEDANAGGRVMRHVYCMLYRCSYSGSWQFMLRISQYMLHFHGWIALRSQVVLYLSLNLLYMVASWMTSIYIQCWNQHNLNVVISLLVQRFLAIYAENKPVYASFPWVNCIELWHWVLWGTYLHCRYPKLYYI
jgi:hypothetical protein